MRKKRSERSIVKAIAAAVGVALGVMLVSAMVSAWMLDKERIHQNAAGTVAFCIHVVSVVIGTSIAGTMIGKNRLVVCMVTACGYYIALLILTLSFGDEFGRMGITAAAVGIGGGISAIIGLIRGTGGAHRKKFSKYS